MSSASANARLKEILKAGQLFEGKYRILKPLGAGSFAVVVQARHEVMGRDVAIKFLKPKMVEANPEVERRFVNEVQIASKLKHPNLVSIYDFGKTSDGIYYMVQEFVDGVELDEIMPKGKPLETRRALNIITQVLSCLSVAHAQGIVHRDLKPSNLMSLQREGKEQIKILDFGVAKLLDDSNASGPVRQSTKFIGTPIYMSPEQILGQEVHPSSDLYSVGLMLYEMLTGQPPIQAQKVAEVVQQHLSDSPFEFPYLSLLDERLGKVILRATERHPEFRFKDAQTFLDALQGKVDLDEAADRSQTMVMDSGFDEPLVPRGADEQAPGFGDVFSGDNYIRMPEDDYGGSSFEPLLMADDAPSFSAGAPEAPSTPSTPSSPSRQRRDPQRGGPRSAGPPRRRPDPITNAPPPQKEETPPALQAADEAPSQAMKDLASGALELDMDVVRDVRRQRTQQARAVGPRPSAPRSGPGASSLSQKPDRITMSASEPGGAVNYVWAAVGLVSAYVGFVVGSAVMYGSGTLAAVLGGLAPLSAALIWASATPSHHVGVMDRWVVPISKRTPLIVAALSVFVLFGAPGTGRMALYHDSTWFFESLPEAGFSALERMTQGPSRAFSRLCARVDHTLYGGDAPGTETTVDELIEPELIDPMDPYSKEE